MLRRIANRRVEGIAGGEGEVAGRRGRLREVAAFAVRCRPGYSVAEFDLAPMGEAMVRGIQFVVDSSGRKTAVQIDLREQRRLWEDFYDRALAKQRASEPRESLETVKKRVLGRYQRRRRG